MLNSEKVVCNCRARAAESGENDEKIYICKCVKSVKYRCCLSDSCSPATTRRTDGGRAGKNAMSARARKTLYESVRGGRPKNVLLPRYDAKDRLLAVGETVSVGGRGASLAPFFGSLVSRPSRRCVHRPRRTRLR